MDDEKNDKPAKKGGIMALLGVPGEDDDGEEDLDGGDMALKAAWRAIKEDDCEGFCEAMTEWLAANGSEE